MSYVVMVVMTLINPWMMEYPDNIAITNVEQGASPLSGGTNMRPEKYAGKPRVKPC